MSAAVECLPGQALADEGCGEKETLLGRLSALAQAGSAAQLEIGDLLASGVKKWSEIYSEAAARTGYSVGRLRNLVNVSRSVPTSLRSDVVLPFDYYAAVARLKKNPEAQEELLVYAAEQRVEGKGLSVDTFREYVKAKHPPTKNPKHREEKLRVTVEPSREVYEYMENLSLDWKMRIEQVALHLIEQARMRNIEEEAAT